MPLSVRAKNFLAAGSLGTFCLAIYGYTFRQMSRVRVLLCWRSRARLYCC